MNPNLTARAPINDQHPKEAIAYLKSKVMPNLTDVSAQEARKAVDQARIAVNANQPSLAMLIVVNSASQLIETANSEFLKECGSDNTRHMARKILNRDFKAKVIEIYCKILDSVKATYVQSNPLADNDMVLTKDEMITDIETRLKIIILEKGTDISEQDLRTSQEKIKRTSSSIRRMEDNLKKEPDATKKIDIIRSAKLPQKLVQIGEVVRGLARKPTRNLPQEEFRLASAEASALYRKLAILSIAYNAKVEEPVLLDTDTVELTCKELDSSLVELLAELNIDGYHDHNDLALFIKLIEDLNNSRDHKKVAHVANLLYKYHIPLKFKHLQNARASFYRMLRPNPKYAQFVYTPKNIIEGSGRVATVLGVPINSFTKVSGEDSLSNEQLANRVIEASREYQSGVAIAIAKLRPYGYILDKMARGLSLTSFEINYVEPLDAEQKKVLYVLHQLNRHAVNISDFVCKTDVWKRAVQKENAPSEASTIKADREALRRPLSETLKINK